MLFCINTQRRRGDTYIEAHEMLKAECQKMGKKRQGNTVQITGR